MSEHDDDMAMLEDTAYVVTHLLAAVAPAIDQGATYELVMGMLLDSDLYVAPEVVTHWYGKEILKTRAIPRSRCEH